MRTLALAFCLAGFAAGQSGAGPWLRAEGDSFLAFSAENAGGGDFFIGFYGEHGLRPDLTLGLDMGVKQNDLDKAIVFAKYPLSGSGPALNVTFELGLGVQDDAAVLRPGVNFGHAYVLAGRAGWTSLELKAVIEPDGGDHQESADLTIGLNLSSHHKAMFQVFSKGSPINGESLVIAPSLIFEAAPGRQFQIGVQAGIRDGDDASAIKLGLWHEF